MGLFRLQFPVGDIMALAARYDFDPDDEVAAAGASARERGYYTKPELVLVCEWKTVRSRSRVARNTAGFVEGITRVAFATSDESERMAALRALHGVNPPTASVLLHFAFPDRYPIIDWRALESLGRPRQATYTIEYWVAYVDACRKLASASRRDDEGARQGAVAVLARTAALTDPWHRTGVVPRPPPHKEQ